MEPFYSCRDERGKEGDPKLTVLNFSGGQQSSCLLWMVLNGDLEVPDDFVVLNADPGMENSGTYEYIEMMFEECEKQGIEHMTVDGPNLYEDLTDLEDTDETRIDNPPYWTKDEEGSVGRLRQKCTQHYKIAPMDRAIRKILEDRFGISRKSRRLGYGIVEKWIGFGADEADRIKPPDQKYVRFRYPLIEREMKEEDVLGYYIENGHPVPPRSVCNACFANDVEMFLDMKENRPEDFEQAVEVDEAVRDMSQVGIEDEVYVSHAAKPLKELSEEDLDDDDLQKRSCDSGYCFI